MKKLNILVLSILFLTTMQFAQTNNSTLLSGDSLVDIFPLAIGNQWIYSFSTTTYQESFPHNTYSGTDTIQIIGIKIIADTIKWLMRSGISTDTIELNELQQGRHQLFINKSVDEISTTIFPFYPDVDTMVFRYGVVDSLSVMTLHSLHLPGGKGSFYYTFKQGIGLLSVNFNDGCTCLDGFYGHRSLLGQIITSVDYMQTGLWNYYLNQNYPNPFNPVTTIQYSIPERSLVRIIIYNTIGEEVEILVAEEKPAGSYEVNFDGSGLPSGIYFYRLDCNKYSYIKKMVLLK